MITLDFLRNNYKYSHTASRRGYESRCSHGHAEPYNGRYGHGYIWVSPRYDTTQYVYITYYLTK